MRAPERDRGEPKKQFHVIAWPSNFSNASATLEETFLNGCLKSITMGHHMQNQSRRQRIRNTHGFLLKRQPPACQRILVATKDRSGWTQCQAEKTGDIEQTTRGQDNKKKGEEQHFKEKPKCVAQQRERWTPPGNFRHFANSYSEGRSCLMARTSCNLSSQSRRCNHEGKNSNGLDCLVQKLARTW